MTPGKFRAPNRPWQPGAKRSEAYSKLVQSLPRPNRFRDKVGRLCWRGDCNDYDGIRYLTPKLSWRDVSALSTRRRRVDRYDPVISVQEDPRFDLPGLRTTPEFLLCSRELRGDRSELDLPFRAGAPLPINPMMLSIRPVAVRKIRSANAPAIMHSMVMRQKSGIGDPDAWDSSIWNTDICFV
jgi:hypothetical protein